MPLPRATPIETVSGSSTARAILETAKRIRSATCAASVVLVWASKHAELLAAVAVDDVAGANLAAQHIGYRAECLIAGIVAVLVVDPLEVVDVDHDHCNGRVAVVRLDRQIPVEPPTIADSGQGVAQRKLCEMAVPTTTYCSERPEGGADRREQADRNQGEHDGAIRRR